MVVDVVVGLVVLVVDGRFWLLWLAAAHAIHCCQAAWRAAASEVVVSVGVLEAVGVAAGGLTPGESPGPAWGALAAAGVPVAAGDAAPSAVAGARDVAF